MNFYIPASGQVIPETLLRAETGFDPSTDTTVLTSNGIYPVTLTNNPYDLALYRVSVSYVVSGNEAIQTWTPDPYPLSTAKIGGSGQVRTQASVEETAVVTQSGLSDEILTAVSGQDALDRPARFQTVLDAMSAVSDNLDANLTAIDAATTVDEINDVVNPPTGIIFTGRGSGLGPEDLNVSYYTEWNSVSLPESDSELYVPSTSTVIAYGSGGAGKFDSAGNCFNVGGPYVIQIRQASTSRVIAEITVPLNPAGEDVAF
jgi:hypothetical protein